MGWNNKRFKDLNECEKRQMFVLQQEAYKDIGVFLNTYPKFEAKMENRECHLLQDPEGLIHGYFCYKPTRFGRKYTIMATMGNSDDKKETIHHLIEKHKEEGAYAEASKKIGDILEKNNIPIICDAETVKEVIDKPDAQLDADCSYLTNINGDIKNVRKKLYGYPISSKSIRHNEG